MGFEPTRAEHNGLAVHRLNHSATSSQEPLALRALKRRRPRPRPAPAPSVPPPTPSFHRLPSAGLLRRHDAGARLSAPRLGRSAHARGLAPGLNPAAAPALLPSGSVSAVVVPAVPSSLGVRKLAAGGLGRSTRRAVIGVVGGQYNCCRTSETSKMDQIYSESSEDKYVELPEVLCDFTDCTIKRRISSILKAPRTPLRDVGNENELIQDCKVEKPQRNSRRVSFADTIRFYPLDPQTILELDHAVLERTVEARDQAALNTNEDLKIVPCEITGMNTLLHAPIQMPLEEIECRHASTGQAWNKMDRTLIFSEENDMDMTAGHTIMITQETGMSQTDKPGKEDFIFSDELKAKKEASELKEFGFFSNPTKLKETCTSQQKTHTENIRKINVDDFLKNLKSTKLLSAPTADRPLVSSEVPERSMYSSGENAYFHSEKEKHNTVDVFCRQENRTVEEYCISNRKATVPFTGHPLGCGEVTLTYENQGTNTIVANTERILPCETSSLNKTNQQESVRRGCTFRTGGLKTSNYHLDIQQDPRMRTVNNKEGIAKNQAVMVTSSNASLASHQEKSTVPLPFGSFASVPASPVDKTVFSRFYADMEMTGNCTGLILGENSKHIGNHYGMPGKQKNDISNLMEKTVFEENDMDITNNQASTNSCENNMQYSISYNEMAASNQKSTYDNAGLLNPRLNSGTWESSFHEKENSLPASLSRDRSADFSAKNIDLNSSHIAKSNIKQAKNPFRPLYNSVMSFHQITSVESKTNGKSRISDNAIALIPPDKTVYYEDMEITKPTTFFIENDLKTAQFQDMPQQEMRTGKKSTACLDSDKTVVFSLNDDNEMEITKSCTVAVNNDIMQQFEQVPQTPSLQPVNKTIYQCYNDMEETKPITCIINQSPENICARAVQKLDNEACGRTFIGSTKDKTVVFSLSAENEMEITRSNTVAFNQDIVPQCEKTPVPSVWNYVDIAECHTKGNIHKNLVKPGKHAEWESSSNQMSEAMLNNRKTVKSHSVPSDSKTDLNNQPVSQARFAFSLCKLGALESFQNNAEITNLPFNTIGNGNLVRSKKQEMSRESMDNIQTSTCGLKIKDAIYGSNNNISNAEKLIPNSMKLGEKFPFLDENKVMTKNYTTRIDFMHTNAVKNECCLLSQEQLNSVLPTSADSYGIKLGVDKDTFEPSICSANVMPSVSQTIVQEQRRSLKIPIESYTSNHNNLSNETASNGLYHSEKKSLVWPEEMPAQNSKFTEERTLDLNTEKKCMLATENESLKNDSGKLSQLRQEGNYTGGTESVLVVDKETKNYKTASCEHGSVTKDWQTKLNCPLEEKPLLSAIVNDCSKLNDIGNKSELVIMPQNIEPIPGEQLPRLMIKPEDGLVLKEDIQEFSNSSNDGNIMEDVPFSVPLNSISQNHCQMTKLPLGIFPPKLPNRRKSAISNVEEICARSEERPEIQDSENTFLIKKPSGEIAQNLSPSHYIDEELPPACAEEMDSSESLHCEELEKPCSVENEKEIITYLSEIVEANKQKRSWNQEDEELQKEKKFKVDESWNDSAESKQPLSSTVVAHSDAEAHEDKNVQDPRTTNLERTQSSNSSSLDSIKADTDFIQQNSELEAPLFMDSICEQNLQEKLQEGIITVQEFFTLLRVHVVIQKLRQSQLPPNYAVNAAPTPEDEILSQYVYRPKLQVYDEDCQILSDTIEKLKPHLDDQDKLLVNVHKSLWEVMKTYSYEELKGFGAELNKMKSCFTKKSKVLAHRGKAKLYAKLVQNAQFQWDMLQSRLAKVDELLKEMDSCLIALETETVRLESSELDLGDSLAEYESKLKDTESELKSYKAQEEALQREQSNLRDQTQQRISEINNLQENMKSCQELMKKYNFSEWVLKEWDDHQAVFTFLYDSIELTVALGCPVDDATFSSMFCRKIVGLNFKSLLDESKAPPSSKLVQRLIFQFINSQRSWQEKCSTVHNLYQMLHDISLVVSRCQLLGREIEFLDRWGGKFSLLKMEINDMKVKLLFSSSIAFVKFEVELSLSASYPASPVAFTVTKCTGKLGQEEISAVLSSVPVGANYLKRMIDQIHHNLLQCPSAIPKQQR
ncbi:kinetochore scaffold 1 [Tiliqua scincoides]|uniref:kinetochore scaffold 1 n=1 Tax=Tiliqua scincoides TaxID=71010 RepID=UPI003461B3DF